jgi:tellurite resistance protein TerC
VKLVMEALHENELSFINGGEHITAVPQIPIWLSLVFILGTLAVTTVASLTVSRRDTPDRSGDGPRRASP